MPLRRGWWQLVATRVAIAGAVTLSVVDTGWRWGLIPLAVLVAAMSLLCWRQARRARLGRTR